MAEKAHAAGKRTGSVGFLCIWLFCQIIRSFRNQPVKVALIASVLQYPELFKLFLGKGFGNIVKQKAIRSIQSHKVLPLEIGEMNVERQASKNGIPMYSIVPSKQCTMVFVIT